MPRITRRLYSAWILLLALPLAAACAAPAPQPRNRPNIVFLLADDLGYGDLSCFGQTRFRTPNLDRLAAEGTRLTHHYAGCAVCAPSRCVLMTGLHPGHGHVRDNREIQPEGQEPLPAGTVTLPRLLQQAGYVTGAFGKWGLGGPGSSGDPLKQGFNRFFGYNCQRVAHNYYPTYLWDNDRRVQLNNPDFSAHQKLPAGADPEADGTYAGYIGKEYAPDRITAEALRFVRENREKPFFLYYPTTVPHLALQVPDDSLRQFKDKFPEQPYDGSRSYLPHRYPRAAYAAMVTRMDRSMGRIIDLVRALGLERDTLFVFSSDNGPLYDQLGGTDTDFFHSANGFRGRKGSLYEGGVRVPAIVRWKGRLPEGKTSEAISGFEDWLPTLLSLSGLKRQIPAHADGIDLSPTLRGEAQPPRPFLYREFAGYTGWQAVWKDGWKAVRQNLNPGPKAALRPVPVELYDLRHDPAEAHDVAVDHPGRVRELSAIMQREHVPSREFPIRALDHKPAP